MGGAYDNRYEFPIRMLNDEIREVLSGLYPQDTKISELQKGLQEAKEELSKHLGTAQNPLNVCTWLEFQETEGNVSELEEVLIKYKIPFDRWCSAAEGNNPDYYYYRPDSNIGRVVQITHDNDEFILFRDLKPLLEKKDPKAAIEEYIKRCSSDGITPIQNYCHETKLGHNQDAMTEINEVLASLDRGEIDNTAAMNRIAAIKKKAGMLQDANTDSSV